jgi:lipopolysaccharide transport system ATP-binding protein
MADVVISATGLAKKYRIGVRHEPYSRLTESLWDLFTSPFRRNRDRAKTSDFWALREVSFEVERGAAVGIIGRNGAGKSTLLKILSRITDPTAGRAELHGRVGSLLEVGTGFHPELSGRENIFLSGAILGTRRAEIRRSFDGIVDFAGVGPFIDTPVKRYSSGMKVRLGFAVAAFLEAEILFIDEVLAVGDAEFQKKCLAKISQIGGEGRTVMFVSHSMPSILRLCDRAILLDRGRIVSDGPTQSVVRAYLQSDLGNTSERRWAWHEAPGDEVARLKSVRVVPAYHGQGDEVDITRPIDIEVEYWSMAPGSLRPSVNLHFFNGEGVCLFVTNDWNDISWWKRPRPTGVVRSVCRIPGNFLAEGQVSVSAAVSTYNPTIAHVSVQDAVAFNVVDRTEGDGVRGVYANEWPGVVRPMLEWNVVLAEPLGSVRTLRASSLDPDSVASRPDRP